MLCRGKEHGLRGGRQHGLKALVVVAVEVRGAGSGRLRMQVINDETDQILSDGGWADVVGEYLHRVGPAPRGDEEAVRLVAVRHADNHVHVVATLARQDGKRVWPRDDFYRAREPSLAVEARYGLTRTSPADRTGDQQTSRTEQRRHTRQAERRAATRRPVPAGPDREVLRGKVRAALAGASSFTEFSERLGRDGVLVRPRMSVLDPDEVTYAVALRASGAAAAEGAEPVWFGGGKLAPDLTLPQLKARWCREGIDARQAATTARARTAGLELDPSERQALWDAAGQALGRADEQLRAAAHGHPASRAMAEAAAVAASEILAAVGRLTERSGAGPLRQAADAYDRAARGLRDAEDGLASGGRHLTVAVLAEEWLRHCSGELSASTLQVRDVGGAPAPFVRAGSPPSPPAQRRGRIAVSAGPGARRLRPGQPRQGPRRPRPGAPARRAARARGAQRGRGRPDAGGTPGAGPHADRRTGPAPTGSRARSPARGGVRARPDVRAAARRAARARMGGHRPRPGLAACQQGGQPGWRHGAAAPDQARLVAAAAATARSRRKRPAAAPRPPAGPAEADGGVLAGPRAGLPDRSRNPA